MFRRARFGGLISHSVTCGDWDVTKIVKGVQGIV
jgi:hypothetical protein